MAGNNKAISSTVINVFFCITSLLLNFIDFYFGLLIRVVGCGNGSQRLIVEHNGPA
jgi:hypothetical protein